MSDENGGMSCSLGCWALAAGVGLVTFILLMVLGGQSLITAIFLGGLAFVLLGLLFNWLFCGSLPKMGESAPSPMHSVPQPVEQRSVSGGASGAAAAAAAAPSAPVASPPKASAPEAPAPSKPAPAAAAVEDSAPAAAEEAPAAAPAAAAAASSDVTGIGEMKPSAALAGEAELAERKGSWKYDGGNAKGDAPAPKAEAAADKGVDYDGDGKLEGTEEGSKPQLLTEAREGGPDNLKEIKGIGPKLEQLCHRLGVFHFDQIAAWTAEEEAWVNANLEGFKGRVSRDEWIAQAKILAAGGDTEFSKRVEDGGVY